MSLTVAGALAGGPAGLAVGAVVDMVKSAIGDILGTLQQGFSKMKALVEDTVGAFRPIEIELFTRAVNDLRAAVGTILLPVMQEITAIVRNLADYIYSLPGSFKALIRNFAEIALVAGIVATVLSTVAAALASFVVIGLGPLGPLLALSAALAGLVYLFSQTEGGARFFSKALQFVEQTIAGIQAVAENVWQQVQPVYQELRKAFSELGDSLSDLLEALKPLIAGGLALLGTMIKNWLLNFISNLTDFVNILATVAKGIEEIIKRLHLDYFLPDVSRDTKSARGLGLHGGNITDLLGSFRQMQESILNFASRAEQDKQEAEQREAIKETAKNTRTTAAILGDWLQRQMPEVKLRNPLGVIFRAGRP